MATKVKKASEDHENIFQALEDEAAREELVKKAEAAMTQARISLILERTARGVFFAHLALRVECYHKFGIGTMATDGSRIIYEPEFVCSLTKEELVGVLVHEVMHCVLDHMGRRNSREPQRFNVAADLAINHLLKEAGYSLPKGGCFVGQKPFEKLPENLSAEEYYDLIPDLPKGMNGQDPGGCGGFEDPKDQAAAAQNAADWAVSVAAAETAAKQKGDLPASIARLLGQLQEAKIDWKAQLREFLTIFHPVRNDWNRPNRRYLNQGLYLPTLNGERLGHIAVAIDTSGSIGEDELKEFGGEIMGIIGESPTKLTVVWCDAAIGRIDEYDDISQHDLKLDGPGGGGTSHKPVFAWVDQQDPAPDCVVCLTDLCTDFPDKPSPVPTLWVSTVKDSKAPWGDTIHLR